MEFVFSNLDFLINYLKSCQRVTMWWPAGGTLPGHWKKTASRLPFSGFGTHLGCSTFLCTKAFSSVATLLEFLQNALTFNSVGPVKPIADLLASVSYKKYSEMVISPGIFLCFSLYVFWVEQLQDLLLYRVLCFLPVLVCNYKGKICIK